MYPRIWPVIHLNTIEQAFSNAHVAQKMGACGVFLIRMDGLDDMIERLTPLIASSFPKLKLGASYLIA